ncbi:hypothetical protein [uncultured Winogradskyella sp.]|uniref:hypothetical protein n=1 Tax=uncultured Winogradskyella sp. TaxID=395353 RepID=UPI0026285DB7|nr:hypothetical protein [uncultured Winogradskyella sp.]
MKSFNLSLNKVLLLVSFIMFIAAGNSQNKNVFMGFIKIKDTLLIKYKVEFESVNGNVSGYSLTDFGGEHETKSKIVGNYNEEKNLLSFKEVGLIYTKSNYAEQDFCNIHLEPTKFKLGGTKLMGEFKGRFSDGTECIHGELAMNSIEKIDKRVTKFKNKLQKSNRVPDSIKQQIKNLKLADTLNFNILKKDEVTSVITSANTITCTVYDGGQIDNDIITVYLNDKIVLYKYVISDQRKILNLPITEKKSRIKIKSESVGNIGENTTYFIISDKANTVKTVTNLKLGEITNVDIIKKE